MAVLVLYATVEGHSRKVATHIAEHLEDRRYVALLGDVREPGFTVPGTFDAVFICAPVHLGRYPEPIARFIEDWKDALVLVPTGFVSISLSIQSDNPEERAAARTFPEKLSRRTGFYPSHVHHAAGALKYLEYDYFKRLLMRQIAGKEGGPVDASRDYEFTDWDALNGFVDDVIAEIRG
ncbi:protoporphyrinogen oxidase [Pseudohoeflea suaedae]|uniref:Protoporphyrinogen oxidase n=1 Tax=Pseudohoeflea suaedae TaxID=877384 RepID=A0A4R5PKA7_9HYPH|nr:flavodoxin domain-containing protein [Pseudohoeflea suaedae]TDH36143.1 protoporphyrinogen oxidase [Pseudohoeflea suaedae]